MSFITILTLPVYGQLSCYAKVNLLNLVQPLALPNRQARRSEVHSDLALNMATDKGHHVPCRMAFILLVG